MKNPAPGEVLLQAPVCAGGKPPEKLFFRKGSGGPRGYQDEHESAICCGSFTLRGS